LGRFIVKKAIKYFRLSAKQGDLSSLYNYALTLEKMENYTKAMKYYEKGHATGDSESTYSLCELLYELHRNDQDVDKKNRADKLLLKLISTTNDSKALELYRFNNPTEDDYQI
jgi:TPR repeat protein